MRLNRISKFTKPITNRLLLTQQAVISQIVCGILFSRSLLLAEIARGFEMFCIRWNWSFRVSGIV